MSSFVDDVASVMSRQVRLQRAPWQQAASPGRSAPLPMNPVAGARYRGINALWLLAQGHSDPRWLTYDQAAASGAMVRRGERGTRVLLSTRCRTNPTYSVVVPFVRPNMRMAVVFNAAQIDGLDPSAPAAHVMREPRDHRAELARLADAQRHPHGSIEFARGVLRKEIATLLVGATLGAGHEPSVPAGYARLCADILKNNPLEIFQAAADAERMHDRICGREEVHVKTIGIREATASHAGKTIRVLSVPAADKDAAKAMGAQRHAGLRCTYLPDGVDVAAVEQRWPGSVVSQHCVRLAVPYGEHNGLGNKGAWYDKSESCWYARPNVNLKPLAQWLPENLVVDRGEEPAPREEFADALREAGCVVTEPHPIMDGEKHRIAIASDTGKETSAFYVVHLSGAVPAGYIKNHRTQFETKWKAKGYRLSPEAKTKLRADALEQQQLREATREQLHAAAAERCRAELVMLQPVREPTPYLEKKGIGAHKGAFTDGMGKTCIPIVTVDEHLVGMQYISRTGTKRLAKGSRKAGCFHAVGGLRRLATVPVLVVSEGYATAATVAEALGHATVCAFDSGNLRSVAEQLHAKYPGKPILIAGDDDLRRELDPNIRANPGKTKALEAAGAVDGLAVFPVFAPGEQAADMKGRSDFNDLAMNSSLGKAGVLRQILSAIQHLDKGRDVVKAQTPSLGFHV